MTPRYLCALRLVDRARWEALVRSGEAELVVSARTMARWRRELGIVMPLGGRRSGSGRPKLRRGKEST